MSAAEQLVLAPLLDGAKVVDTCSAISPIQAKALRALDTRGVVRYAAELTRVEAEGICHAGLGLALVSHVRWAGEWVPTSAMGQGDGRRMVERAKALGYPAGGLCWLDLEGVAGYVRDRTGGLRAAVPEGAIEAYCNAWAQEVVAVGYLAGLYVGAGCGLHGVDLGRLPLFHAYWRSASSVPEPEPRGYCMIQGAQVTLHFDADPRSCDLHAPPLLVDVGHVQADKRGDLPVFAFLPEAGG